MRGDSWQMAVFFNRRLAVFAIACVLALAVRHSLTGASARQRASAAAAEATVSEASSALERQLTALREEYARTLSRAVSAEAKLAVKA